ncbi:MAG: glycosyltransferase family 1 protein [Bacteroidetes bacterium]|nr:glycosyltransferase family 1 protein [Bacteroidota bacterium]
MHVFLYKGKMPAPALEALTEKTHYYYRRRFVNPFWGSKPYVVTTRNSEKLMRNLLLDDYPILFEGLHTTAYLGRPELKDRTMVVRAHNVEHNYYRALGEAERRWIKQKFFFLEAKRLQNYEPILKQAHAIAAISPMETAYFQKTYGNTHYIPAFHSNSKVMSLPGKGDYVLYHGNLSIPENDRAAIYLVNEVFPLLSQPCIVAGSNPSQMLQNAAAKYPHIQIKANLTAEEIFDLVRNAHVNTLVTFQSTGIKLKLLNALYRGRHLVANTPMVEETQLESLCQVSDDPKIMAHVIKQCFLETFDESNIQDRENKLAHTFNNAENAKKLMALFETTT